MPVYIRSAANISPQKTFGTPSFLNEPVEYTDNRLTCIEPAYNTIIEPKLIRRMSRIIKMSVASALTCLKDADIASPDAIVTGTAYGCLEDTGIFLTNVIQHGEEPVTPIAFVQSTHNTIGAQIALLINCNQYNNTFVSGGASFENALTDTIMLLAEGNNANILVGAMDEITDASHTILSRMGLYKRGPLSNFNLFGAGSKGTIGGEGAAFFLATNKPSADNLARVDAVATFNEPEDLTEIEEQIASFLAGNSITGDEIDLLITGNNGDTKNDTIYTELQRSFFNGTPSVNYKHLCGEYPTSTAFALWLGANIIKSNNIPSALDLQGTVKRKINKLLIYNHYQNISHSLILISAC
jgi:3-oxoacyl-[acyl-carrier-protein] synthase II